MSAGLEVTSLTFNDGSQIDCEGYDVVLIVGPNNSGKTRSLLDIIGILHARSQGSQAFGLVVKTLEVTRRGSAEDLWAAVKTVGDQIPAGQDEQYLVNMPGRGYTAFKREVAAGWASNSGPMWIERIFSLHLGPEQRESLSNDQASIDFGRAPRSHPLHNLHQDRDLRQKLCDAFRRAFGQEIAVDLQAGSVIPLHIGEAAFPKSGETEYDRAYRDRLRSYPRLNEQGHGMRSFGGILLHCWASFAKLIMIDEPEAFLHPPQARLLARLLAEQHEPGRQLVIATHSTDIIRGVLECPDIRAKVIRLRREGERTIARELSHDDINEVWADPVTRYSNILDGLFYERVVVCEADGDCRFYQAIADALREPEGHVYARDVMFTQAGGKGGITKLVRALRKLEVPVVAVVDFDIFREWAVFANLLSTLGGDPQSILEQYSAIRQNIDKMGKALVADIKANIRSLLDGVPDTEEAFPSNVSRKIQSACKPHIGWQKAKSNGIGVLDPGAPSKAGVELLDNLASAGLLVVPRGELESFDPVEAPEKNEWVNTVMEKYRGRFATAPELQDAQKFVKKMLS